MALIRLMPISDAYPGWLRLHLPSNVMAVTSGRPTSRRRGRTTVGFTALLGGNVPTAKSGTLVSSCARLRDKDLSNKLRDANVSGVDGGSMKLLGPESLQQRAGLGPRERDAEQMVL